MKKYITLAALLTAGSICSNAATESLTLTSPTGGSLTSSNAYVSWEQDYSILESWSLSFTLTDSVLADDQAVFSTTKQGGGGATGYILKTQADGGIGLYEDGGVDTLLISVENVLTAGAKSGAITLSFVANVLDDSSFQGGTFSLGYGDDVQSVEVKGISGRPEKINGATALIKGEQTFNNDNTVWSSRFWTNGGSEKIYDIKVEKLDSVVIPEPSAFGLLAGVGALALVASRRRRR